jgi:DNA polymerase-3 subunit beta
MKLVVTQENLSKALQVVGKVATGKTPLPILNNILFRTDKNRLLLAATNLEIAITQYVGSKIEKEGTITIPARLMSEFIGNLPKGNITLEADGTKLSIKSGNYQSTINGMLPEEFPALPEVTVKQQVTLNPAILKRALQQTVLVTSADDTRPVLTGAYFHTHEGRLYIAATDSYRLAERLLGPSDGEISAIIPSQTLQEVLRIMNDDMGEIGLVIDDNQIRFLLEDVEITSRLIDGSFPAYRHLIPAKSDVEVVIDKDEFVRITKIASLFARESAGSVTISADEAKQTLSVHSIASQLGENTSEAAATVSTAGQVTLNSRYLLDALGCIDSPLIRFAFGEKQPCVLAGSESAEYKHVIMPLKS